MRLFDYLFYLVALIFYLPRLILFWTYRTLLFLSKPGALYILPGILGGLLYWQYDLIISLPLFDWWVRDIVAYYMPHRPLLEPYWYVGLIWVLFTFFLYLLNGGERQVLGTILSAIPQIRRPFPPTLRLRLVERKIKPATVRLVVPRLGRRGRGKRAPDLKANLAEPLQRLLESQDAVPSPTDSGDPVVEPETPVADADQTEATPSEPDLPEPPDEAEHVSAASEPEASDAAPATDDATSDEPLSDADEAGQEASQAPEEPEPKAAPAPKRRPSGKPPAPFVPPKVTQPQAE
jgi:hypothetical protein